MTYQANLVLRFMSEKRQGTGTSEAALLTHIRECVADLDSSMNKDDLLELFYETCIKPEPAIWSEYVSFTKSKSAKSPLSQNSIGSNLASKYSSSSELESLSGQESQNADDASATPEEPEEQLEPQPADPRESSLPSPPSLQTKSLPASTHTISNTRPTSTAVASRSPLEAPAPIQQPTPSNAEPTELSPAAKKIRLPSKWLKDMESTSRATATESTEVNSSAKVISVERPGLKSKHTIMDAKASSTASTPRSRQRSATRSAKDATNSRKRYPDARIAWLRQQLEQRSASPSVYSDMFDAVSVSNSSRFYTQHDRYTSSEPQQHHTGAAARSPVRDTQEFMRELRQTIRQEIRAELQMPTQASSAGAARATPITQRTRSQRSASPPLQAPPRMEYLEDSSDPRVILRDIQETIAMFQAP